MEEKVKNYFILFLVCILFCGCSNTVAPDATMIVDPSDDHVSNIVIYQVTRDDFESFLYAPSIELITTGNNNYYSYPKDGQWHITSEIIRIPIGSDILNFAGNISSLQAYLIKNGVTSELVNTLIIDAPRVPLTIWLETETGDYYITVTDLNKKTEYHFYSADEYCKIYLGKQASLYVNRVEVTTDTAPIVYHNYADIPLVAVLNALGAKITNETDTLMKVFFEGVNYCLDTEKLTLYNERNTDNNLLYQVYGGTIFVYSIEGELMMDSTSMWLTLESMGVNVEINCDSAHGEVNILKKGN